MDKVFCNVCLAPVPIEEITHRIDYPSVGDLTHWHKGHNIVDEPGADNTNVSSNACGAWDGYHLCHRPLGHEGQHVCFMYPGACEKAGY
jgi:hypothetical protein